MECAPCNLPTSSSGQSNTGPSQISSMKHEQGSSETSTEAETSIENTDLPRIQTCNTCQQIRHDLNLSPMDVVHDLCSNSCDGTGRATVQSQGSSMQFTIRATVNGLLLRTLLDTGASTSYCSKTVLTEHPELVQKKRSVEPVAVRLVKHSIKFNFFLCEQLKT